MKAELPNWLWALLILDFVCVVLLTGGKFGGWALPGWLELLVPLVPTLSLVAFGLWECKPGGVWDQYEAKQKERTQEKKQ